MPNLISRRLFLGQAAAATFFLRPCGWSRAAVPNPFSRSGEPRLLLSLAAYSFRDYFIDSTHERKFQAPPEKQLDLFRFIDFCREHGCQGAELTSYYFPKNFDEEFLFRLKRHAFLSGMEISGGAVGNTFTLPPGKERERQISMVKRWIDHCQLLGAPHLRVFAGNREGASMEEAKKRCVAALEECCDYAAGKGIILGLENHGGIVAEADDLLDIIGRVNHPWFGINLDTGNFATDDPYGDLEKCAPWAVNVQLKVEMRKRNQPKEEADLEKVVGLLRKANYQGYVALEYEAAEDPWKAIPPWLARLRTHLD
jgi:sugar phosphate isomerase/epimerase